MVTTKTIWSYDAIRLLGNQWRWQRPMDPHKVARLVDELWLTKKPFKKMLIVNGQLVNGQHRLKAALRLNDFPQFAWNLRVPEWLWSKVAR